MFTHQGHPQAAVESERSHAEHPEFQRVTPTANLRRFLFDSIVLSYRTENRFPSGVNFNQRCFPDEAQNRLDAIAPRLPERWTAKAGHKKLPAVQSPDLE